MTLELVVILMLLLALLLTHTIEWGPSKKRVIENKKEERWQ